MIAAPRTSSAQEAGAAEEAGEDVEQPKAGRSVGGHSFSEFQTIAWPFIATRVASLTGFGLAEFTQRSEAANRDFEGTFGLFGERFDLSLAPSSWLDFELFFQTLVLGGADRVGSLFVGVNFGVTSGGAIAVRLVETERAYVLVRGVARATRVEGAAPIRLLDAIDITGDDGVSIEDVRLSELRINFDGEIYTGAGEVAAAVGLSSFWGFLASARLSWREIDIEDSTEREGTIEGGLGVSLDLADTGLPVEVIFGGRLAWDFSDDVEDVLLTSIQPADEFRAEPEVGLFYSSPKRPELDLGISVKGTLASDDNRLLTGIRLGYFW